MKREFTGLILFGGFLIIFLIVQINYVEDTESGDLLTISTLNSFVSAEPAQTIASTANASQILQEIRFKNKAQIIQNLEKFGPVTNETVLITIQVHNRISYLKHLIESLRASRHISTALLIISHDIYDDSLNAIIWKIDFCMVIQIFYPYSIQTHPNRFPGTDPLDCARDLNKYEAESLRCLNHKHPDMYGHYREAKYTQMKHHWWWKLNFIFDQLWVTKRHRGFLLLLEEDYFMAEDFVDVFNLVQRTMIQSCDECNILSLGTYFDDMNENTYNVVNAAPWVTNVHNMGMAFNRTTWNAIKKCAAKFCTYDEYNYDFSLQNINRRCLKNKLVVAGITGPRVYHIGECGVHHTTKNCNADEKVKEVREKLLIAKESSQLFPTALKRGFTNFHQLERDLTPNGGWGDLRDQNLCLKMTMDVS